MFFSPMNMEKLIKIIVGSIHWMIGPSLKDFLHEEKYVNIKFFMEGPTFIIPESRENPQLIAVHLGKITAENLQTKDGKVENMMINMMHGQIFSGMMGIHQNMELIRILVSDITCKLDIKLENNGSSKKHLSVLSLDNIKCNMNSDDIHLIFSILYSNILKLKVDIGSKYLITQTRNLFFFLDQLLSFLPTKIIPDESEHLLSKDRNFYGNIMIERITFNLNDLNDEDFEMDARSNSPVPENDLLFQITLHVR